MGWEEFMNVVYPVGVFVFISNFLSLFLLSDTTNELNHSKNNAIDVSDYNDLIDATDYYFEMHVMFQIHKSIRICHQNMNH